MTADDHMQDAQLDYAASRRYIALAGEAHRAGAANATYFAATAAALATLSQLSLVAYAQHKNGRPREERIDRYNPDSPAAAKEPSHG